VQSLLGEVQVSALQNESTGSKGPQLLIRPLDRPQILTQVSRRRFPWSRCGIATR
jgi:hypothetical protein